MKNIILNKYKTLPIGTIFTYKGNKYEVCKYNWTTISSCCSLCAFCGINCDENKSVRGECYSARRLDNSNIYFKLLEDNKDNKDNKDINNISNIIPTFNTDNSLNDLHIDCPKGYSIDVENSDLSKGIIKFKKDNITLEDIYKDDNIEYAINLVILTEGKLGNKLSCIAKLIDIANYYNKGWKPNWNDYEENKYYIRFNSNINKNDYDIGYRFEINHGIVFFKNKEDAQEVIDNPNFRDILDTIYKD